MAARRVAKTAVEWTAFAERVAPSKKDAYRRFKALNDQYLGRVHEFPEELPKIDFAFYKSRLENQAMAAEFEKAYAAVNIPYPEDTQKLMSTCNEMEQTSAAALKEEKEVAQTTLGLMKEFRTAIDNLPPYEEFTVEMMKVYFPDKVADQTNDPKHWPFHKAVQTDTPGNRVLNYGGAKPNPFAPKPKAIQ